MKWGLVLAGISDFARPAEKLSLTQNGALTATGLIWTRWCLIIKPKNYLCVSLPFFRPVVALSIRSHIDINKPTSSQLPPRNNHHHPSVPIANAIHTAPLPCHHRHTVTSY